jgi:RNA polymerase sigma-70 factor (ECF subfamily)
VQIEAEPDKFPQAGSSQEQGPAAVMQGEETEIFVWNAVERLPKFWAMAVILYYREEKSIIEIAKIMQTKENTIKTYLFRSRQKLKKALAPAFGEDVDVGG